jgi:hypothetical protein
MLFSHSASQPTGLRKLYLAHSKHTSLRGGYEGGSGLSGRFYRREFFLFLTENGHNA